MLVPLFHTGIFWHSQVYSADYLPGKKGIIVLARSVIPSAFMPKSEKRHDILLTLLVAYEELNIVKNALLKIDFILIHVAVFSFTCFQLTNINDYSFLGLC